MIKLLILDDLNSSIMFLSLLLFYKSLKEKKIQNGKNLKKTFSFS